MFETQKSDRSKARTVIRGVAMLGVFAAAVAANPVRAQTTYNIAGMADFSGPYADIMKDWSACRHGVVDWWSDEVGKPLGVKLTLKEYDARYDVAQTASLWPGIRAELDPVAILGAGGPDVAALQERLPSDKVPMFMATAAYGYSWKPDPWIFNPRATYPHEAAAFMEWFRQKRGGDKPLKLGIISSEAAPAYVDINKGMEHYAKENPNRLEVVEVIYAAVQPTDLTQQVNRLVRKGVEVILIDTNTAAVVATHRALQSLGKSNIPIMMSSHDGLQASGKAVGGIQQLEGDFEAYGMAIPTGEKSVTSDFYQTLRDKHKMNASFNVPCLMGMSQAFLAVRSIENAVKDAGGKRITGEDVRKALLKHPIPSAQTFGVLPDLKYSEQAPFPIEGLWVNIGTVQNGQYKTAAGKVPIPKVTKW